MDKYEVELKALSAEERAAWQSAYEDAFAQTGDEMKAYLAGWGAVNKMPFMVYTTKSMKGQTVGGWGMLFTDAENKDLDSEYFNQATETLLEYYQNAPLWMEHGQDPDYGKMPIGKRTTATVYPRGIWVEHELNESHPLYKKTLEKVRAGELAYSSDAISHYVERSDDGGLGNWFAAGWSLTKRPAEPALGAVAFKSFEKFITRASHQRTESGAGEPAVDTGKAASKLPLSISNKDMKMPISDADITALQTQLDESLGSVSMAFVERLREMNSDSADDMPEDEAMASADEVQKDVEELAKSVTQLDSVKSAKDINEAFEVATNEIIEGAMERYFNRQAEKTARKNTVNKALEKSFVKFASQDTTPVNELHTTHHNPDAKKSAGKFGKAPAQIGKAEKPAVFGDAIKHAHYTRLGQVSPTKAQSYGSGRLGGFLLDTEVNREIIPSLQAKLILRDLGVNFDTISGDSYTQLKQKTNATAYWVGESQTVPETDMEFDAIHAVTKPLAARVPIPYKLIDDTSYNLEQYARNHLEERIARAIEYAALFGQGATTGSNVGAEPLGLLNTTGVTTTALNRKPTLDDLDNAVYRVQNANVMEDNTWNWAFSPRTKNTFAKMTDTDGQPLIRRSWIDAPETSLVGYNYFTSTTIPNNSIGASDDQSYIFFGKWSDMHVVVSANTAEFLVNPYRLQHQLITELVMYMYVDVYIERDESFQILSDIDD